MARFLSGEWVDAFNASLTGVVLHTPDDERGLATTDGPVTVAEEISGGPDGDVRLLLHIDRGALRLELAEPGGETAPPGPDAAGAAPAVTMAVRYEDAVALSTGELSPSAALNQGRIRVRGDLTVLVDAHRLLAAARPATQALSAATTY